MRLPRRRDGPARPLTAALSLGERGTDPRVTGCAPEWGAWGAKPPTERNSEGGWVGQSRAARSSGMGVWGAQPPTADMRQSSKADAASEDTGPPGEPPHPRP